MPSRYDNVPIGINKTEQYEEVLEQKGINHIRQYFTPTLIYPSDEQIAQLDLVSHTWKQGSRFFKLADEFYGDAKLWWVIAYFNMKPTEQHVQQGEVIQIPLPLDKILRFMEI